MLKIRLQRVGRKHEPSFRLVLTDSKNSTKSGKYLEILGNYDARRGEKSEFKAERISHWMSKGAKASDTVHNLLISKKIIEGKKINALPKKKPILKDSPADAPVVAEAPVAEDAKVEEAEGNKSDKAPATTVEEAPTPVAEEQTVA